ncbi:unnamed protein product [Linum trigynum]|uniref:Secreted protein n=1 Tax=Linum trigynum TaxID=586398 RepID=A0AAV2GG82_9ROSI
MIFPSLRTHASTILLVIGCCSYTFFRSTTIESNRGDRLSLEGTNLPGIPAAGDDDDHEEEEGPELSSEDELDPYERYRRYLEDDQGGDDYVTDPESDDYVSDLVGTEEYRVGGGARNRRGREIPIPNRTPQLIRSEEEIRKEAEISDGEVEQKIKNRESQIRPFMEAPPEDDEQRRSGNRALEQKDSHFPFKMEAAMRGGAVQLGGGGGVVVPPPSFLVQTPEFKLPMVPMFKPTPLLLDFHRLMINSPLMIPNFDWHPLFSPNLRRPPPQPDSTGGSSAADGKDSLKKTEQQGDMNRVDDDLMEIDKILNPDPQPSLPGTSIPLPPSDSTGRSRAVHGNHPQVTNMFQNIDQQQPPLPPALPQPPRPDFTGGRSASSGHDDQRTMQEADISEVDDNFPEIEQQGGEKRQKLN